MSTKNHYDVLGVAKKASQEEIKAAFRKLSLETHPDLNPDTDSETFKAIAEANSVLSSPTERMKYDRQLLERSMWRKPSMYGGDNMRRPGARPHAGGMNVAMQTLSNPRYWAFGIVLFGSMAALLGTMTSKRPEVHLHGSPMIEAWMNPKTKQWEQPAPWDPMYRKLQPKLEMVPRHKVRRRNMGR
mmetsp:Transcript_25637/g.62851  ORF Transcript_25637/g.62851 Transcript_25637/m.62851 type:complete len:186 (+) Transcript_25637:95-652(+)|eukprot:CAMPEP_0113635424 /NCGR_PEP_ID=MMETSP0017_2-20120614/18467_1 /TAXON_ID=2856 /ORGANISM="Cylindrotheca closterium" /LENGTH=185 /DNA_ID=CAMNT_0000546207 /DNA_START=23 /DNA_END=580 /DNA_ORIENTATION=- /assembly_acc=CAM_ASM_000147